MRRLKHRAFVLSVLALPLVASACSAGNSSSATSSAVRVADAYTPNQASYDGTAAFVDALNEAKPKAFDAKHYPNSQLGDETALISSVRSGAIQMSALTSQALSAVDTQFGVFSMPYLFRDVASVEKYANSEAGQKLLDSLDAYGLHGLGFMITGFTDIITKKPVTESSQLRGMTLRTLPSNIEQAAIKALDATPVAVGATQLYLALQQGTVDGVTSTSTFWVGTKLYEVAKHALFTNYECVCDAIVVNAKYWKSLSSDQKQILEDAAKKAATVSYEKNNVYEENSKKALRENGVTVTDQFSDIDEVIDLMKTNVWPELAKKVGPSVAEDAEALLDSSK